MSGFMAFEVGVGILTHSLALLSDAAHMPVSTLAHPCTTRPFRHFVTAPDAPYDCRTSAVGGRHAGLDPTLLLALLVAARFPRGADALHAEGTVRTWTTRRQDARPPAVAPAELERTRS